MMPTGKSSIFKNTRLIGFYVSLLITVFIIALCFIMIFLGDADRAVWVSTLTGVWGVWMQAPKLKKPKMVNGQPVDSSSEATP
jgi:hypothetical protein